MRNGQNKRMRNRNGGGGGHSHSNNNNNNNNNRRGQNPMTRVYESNGPEIKIRGTASHLAEKYVQLARDAQGSGDPVAAENYYQHAEHYFRIIAAAQEQFRQNQPQQFQQPRPDGEMRDDSGDENDGEFSAFGAEPGFAPQPPQQQQPYQPREQPYQREQQFRENRENRPQPQQQPQPPQPQIQPAADGDIDRLPSFITGGQPPQPSGGNFEGGERNERSGDRFQHRRRRRHQGPRPEGAAGTPPNGDFGPAGE
jgi:hypothetical protein